MPPTQAPTTPCMTCHHPATVQPTTSAWEFAVVCAHCDGRRTGIISWAHRADPPRWQAPLRFERVT